ncbi:hypothetical protein F4810DRAFT_711199 [Camillea tinctor]|nr:hypothetical protein F4810DRAFT_711199 [Camillea tinctor]
MSTCNKLERNLRQALGKWSGPGPERQRDRLEADVYHDWQCFQGLPSGNGLQKLLLFELLRLQNSPQRLIAYTILGQEPEPGEQPLKHHEQQLGVQLVLQYRLRQMLLHELEKTMRCELEERLGLPKLKSKTGEAPQDELQQILHRRLCQALECERSPAWLMNDPWVIERPSPYMRRSDARKWINKAGFVFTPESVLGPKLEEIIDTKYRYLIHKTIERALDNLWQLEGGGFKEDQHETDGELLIRLVSHEKSQLQRVEDRLLLHGRDISSNTEYFSSIGRLYRISVGAPMKLPPI